MPLSNRIGSQMKHAHGPLLEKEFLARPTLRPKETLLLAAVARGNKSRRATGISDKGDEDIEARKNEKGETALYIATSRGDKSIVRYVA